LAAPLRVGGPRPYLRRRLRAPTVNDARRLISVWGVPSLRMCIAGLPPGGASKPARSPGRGTSVPLLATSVSAARDIAVSGIEGSLRRAHVRRTGRDRPERHRYSHGLERSRCRNAAWRYRFHRAQPRSQLPVRFLCVVHDRPASLVHAWVLAHFSMGSPGQYFRTRSATESTVSMGGSGVGSTRKPKVTSTTQPRPITKRISLLGAPQFGAPPIPQHLRGRHGSRAS
jgi:hypothetical protein